MTSEQHEQLIREVTNTIRIVVNGKIDGLTKDVAAIHRRLDEQDVAIRPVIEGLQTINGGRKFLLWAAPLALIGSFIAWLK